MAKLTWQSEGDVFLSSFEYPKSEYKDIGPSNFDIYPIMVEGMQFFSASKIDIRGIAGDEIYFPPDNVFGLDRKNFNAIPFWDPEPFDVEIEGNPDDKYELFYCDTSNIKTNMKIPGKSRWPLSVISSSRGIRLSRSIYTTVDNIKPERSGYGQNINYGKVITKGEIPIFRTRFEPPSATKYYNRAIKVMIEQLEDIKTKRMDLASVDPEYQYLINHMCKYNRNIAMNCNNNPDKTMGISSPAIQDLTKMSDEVSNILIKTQRDLLKIEEPIKY